MIELTLKEVGINDIDQLINESEGQFLASKGASFASVKARINFLAHNKKFVPLLFTNQSNEQLGYIIALSHDTYDVYLNLLYIANEYKEQGFGELLVEMFIEWAKKKGNRSIFTTTWGENKAAQKVFEKLGFKIIGEVLDDRINGDKTLHYLLNV